MIRLFFGMCIPLLKYTFEVAWLILKGHEQIGVLERIDIRQILKGCKSEGFQKVVRSSIEQRPPNFIQLAGYFYESLFKKGIDYSRRLHSSYNFYSAFCYGLFVCYYRQHFESLLR